jgi:hypothetical protein
MRARPLCITIRAKFFLKVESDRMELKALGFEERPEVFGRSGSELKAEFAQFERQG